MFCQSTCVWAGRSFIGTIPVIYLLAQYSSHVGYEFTSRIQRICFEYIIHNQSIYVVLNTDTNTQFMNYLPCFDTWRWSRNPAWKEHSSTRFICKPSLRTLVERLPDAISKVFWQFRDWKKGVNMRQKYFYKRRQLTVLFYDDRVVDPLENFNE